MEARRAAGKVRGPLRTALLVAGITLIIFALVIAYWLLVVR
ncbi:MAG TPA: hypothetical protein VFU88_22350 [Ktedonobacterales bacterium]|nr:hypothetical protein [Ktedonobacterales bacterium]